MASQESEHQGQGLTKKGRGNFESRISDQIEHVKMMGVCNSFVWIPCSLLGQGVPA